MSDHGVMDHGTMGQRAPGSQGPLPGGLTCAEADDLAALHVLDVLTADEAAPLHAHLAACDQPHTDLTPMAEAAGALASSVTPLEPPAALRDRLMAAVAVTPQVPDPVATTLPDAPGQAHVPTLAADAPTLPDALTLPGTRMSADAPTPPAQPIPFGRPQRSRPSRVAWVGLAAAAAVAVLVGAWNVSLQRQLSDTDRQLALVRQAVAAAADPTSRVATLTGTAVAPDASGMAVFPASGTGYVMLQGLPALSGDRVYQAWYLADGVPTSAGLMTPSVGEIAILAGLEPIDGTDTIALTIEPAGGLAQPSGDVVVAGALPG